VHLTNMDFEEEQHGKTNNTSLIDLSRSDESGLSAATTNASSSSVEGGPLPPTAHLDGVVNFSICCVGIVVNSTAIGILLRSRNQRSPSVFLKLMISLAFYDLLFVTLFAFYYTMPRLSKSYRDMVQMRFPWGPAVTQMALLGSAYTTVALTLERYISVVTPFFRQKHNLKASMFLVPVASFIVVYSLPRFFELKTSYAPKQQCINVSSTQAQERISVGMIDYLNLTTACYNYSVPYLAVTSLRENTIYIKIYYNWLQLIFNTLLPLSSLIGMNIQIYLTMKGRWGDSSVDHFNSPLGSEQDENKDKNCHLQVTDCSKGGKLKRKFTISFRSKGRDSSSSGHQRMIMRFSSKHQSVRCQQTTLAPDQKRLQPGKANGVHTIERNSNTRVRRSGLNEREVKKQEAKYTRASVVMVVLFILCNTPRIIPNAMELYYDLREMEKMTWVTSLVSVNHLLLVLNSSFNFLIYLSFCGTGGRRRRNQSSTTYSFSTRTTLRATAQSNSHLKHSFNGGYSCGEPSRANSPRPPSIRQETGV